MRGGCSRSFAGCHRGSCVDAALTRASRRLQKRQQPPGALALSLDRGCRYWGAFRTVAVHLSAAMVK